MSILEAEAGAVRQQLEEVLKSPGFARNERLSGFLRFIVGRHLDGRSQELKESVIGIEVFGREPSYDTKADPVVRTEARRLRTRLSAYYNGPGAGDTIVIDLPKGRYVPVIRLAAHVLQAAGSSGESAPRSQRRSYLPWLALAGVIVVVAAIGVRRLIHRGDDTLARDQRPSEASVSPANDLFRRARASEMRPGVRGVEITLDLFEQTIGKDSSFAAGYAGVAAMEAARSAFDRFSPAERAEMIAKGWAAAQKAIQLEPGLADAYDAVAMMQARDAQWDRAEYNFHRAIKIAPHDPLWRYHFALFLLLPLGRIEEAIRELESAEQYEPHSRNTHFGLYVAFRAMSRFDEADSHCIKAAENDEQLSACWSDTFLRLGKTDEALKILEARWKDQLLKMGAESLGVAYARAGRRADAERVADVTPRPGQKVFIFAALGDKDRTFESLDQMVLMGATRVGRELISPEFAFLHGDPRLNVLRKRLGLPD
jgi:tetratricopeptide (TPR) repeat protein